MTVVLGIDAAWTATEPSGIAVLVGGETNWECIAVTPSYSAFLSLATGKPIDWIVAHAGTIPEADKLLTSAECLAGARVDVITIDMPISPIPITGRRFSDNLISREYGKRWCSAHSPNALRPGKLGATLTKEFEQLGYPLAAADTKPGTLSRILEVYPHPALLGLLSREIRVPYKVGKSLTYWPGTSISERIDLLLREFEVIYEQLTKTLGPMPFQLPLPRSIERLAHLKRYEDALDAVISAWVGTLYLSGEAVPFGDENAAVWCPTSSTSR